jgi:hypothetical protein
VPYKVTLPPGEPMHAPQGVSPIPEKAGTAGTSGDTLSHPPDPKARLWILLDTWTGVDEAAWTPEAVDRLKDEILDIFKAHPEAERWFREWRAAHPAARW